MRMTLCTLWVCMCVHDHIEDHPQNIGACMNAEREFYRLYQML